jgi:hypothetical protein
LSCISSLENEPSPESNSSNFVRAEVPLMGWILTPEHTGTGSNSTTSDSTPPSSISKLKFKAQFFIHVSFKGRVPGWVSKQLLKMVTASLPVAKKSAKKT